MTREALLVGQGWQVYCVNIESEIFWNSVTR